MDWPWNSVTLADGTRVSCLTSDLIHLTRGGARCDEEAGPPRFRWRQGRRDSGEDPSAKSKETGHERF